MDAPAAEVIGQDSKQSSRGVLETGRDLFRKAVTEFVGGAAEIALLLAGTAAVSVAVLHTSRIQPLEWRLATLVVLLPFVLSYASFLSAKARLNRMRFDLYQPPGNFDEGTKRILRSVYESWLYERRRFRSSMDKTTTHALIFGLTATLVLALAFVVYHQSTDGSEQARMRSLVAIACATAAAVGFALSFARILVRLSNQDFNARMYSWACRSSVFVLVSTLVASTLLARGNASASVRYPHEAVLLGATIATFGSSLLELIASKASALFGINPEGPRRVSDLELIEGLGQEDIARLAEEGIESLHALAFVPTARLFFGTNHSLQRLVDWQDQALLYVYVGQARAQALKDKMLIRGAIDLWGTVQGMGTAVDDPLRTALGQALGMTETQLGAFVETIRNDQVVRRIHAHWRATVRIRGNARSDGETQSEEPSSALTEETLKRVVDASLAEALARQPSQLSQADIKRTIDQSLREASIRAHRIRRS